jgi:tRNA (cytidine/uridine-2'-O-)-methyltransferase
MNRQDLTPAAEKALFHVVLHQPEIPPNTGNIGRTCVAVGAKLWLVRPLGFRMDDRRMRRAGLDYWQHLDWEIVDDWPCLCRRLPNQQFWLFSKTASQIYTDVSYQRGDALVFGSETQGLPPGILGSDPSRAVRIPMHAEARSLNLAASVAVGTYEALRQINSR